MTSTADNLEGTVLVVDDRENVLKMMTNLLEERFEVVTCNSGSEALERFTAGEMDLVVSDIRMPDKSGMDILREVKRKSPATEVVLMTAYGEVEEAVEALKLGAYDYVIKPFEPDEMILTLEKALERKVLRERTAALEKEVQTRYGFGNIVGESAPMKRAFEMARKACGSDATVMLSGESGTGKEMFARAIHYGGDRRRESFVAINCAAIPRDLIESELFGHVKGAFSGATRDKPGLFEQADEGSLMLDEVTELPPDMQAKINRALQEGEVRRVGDTRERSVNVRVIAATNRDLKEALEEGQFREDLYFRLNVFPIHLPPLRRREGDIPLLVEHFLEEFAADRFRDFTVEPAAMEKLLEYPWPGNVRELRNVIERAVVLSEDGHVNCDLLHLAGPADDLAPQDDVPSHLPYKKAMKEMRTRCQKEYLLAVLKKKDGNVTRAADYAGIERESFHRLMRKCGISRDDIE